MPAFLAQSRDIAPPVDYSLASVWVVFVASFFALTLLVFLFWWIRRRLKKKAPVQSPRERAAAALEQFMEQIETIDPYQFSILVSDTLRHYVTEQYTLPVTRQTSVEFLERLAVSSPFSGEETKLLEDFLSRCDLIKFARYEATSADSHLLLQEAMRFVKGGELATVS
ncbi:MAG: hypothetical protein JWO45_1876 [Spartobacteria bacterium]|nr:hypothetical protein [Spartobacteria bacterium]